MNPGPLISLITEQLRNAREELLAINQGALTIEAILEWRRRWGSTFQKADRPSGYPLRGHIDQVMSGFGEQDKDIRVLADLRVELVSEIDCTLKRLDAHTPIRSLREERILKVKDAKLATLLRELNDAKDASPNMAAIGFRTVLGLILRERAKLAMPTSRLASSTDLALDPDIKTALTDHIFDSAEAKYLQRFQTGGAKDIFDNISHKPGAQHLASKQNLDDGVELLNRLLPTIT